MESKSTPQTCPCALQAILKPLLGRERVHYPALSGNVFSRKGTHGLQRCLCRWCQNNITILPTVLHIVDPDAVFPTQVSDTLTWYSMLWKAEMWVLIPGQHLPLLYSPGVMAMCPLLGLCAEDRSHHGNPDWPMTTHPQTRSHDALCIATPLISEPAITSLVVDLLNMPAWASILLVNHLPLFNT